MMDGDGRVWLRNAGRRRRKSLEQARWKGDRRSTADRQNGEGRRLVEQKDREDQVHGQFSRGWDWAREATGGHRASGRQLRPAGEPLQGPANWAIGSRTRAVNSGHSTSHKRMSHRDR